MSVQVENGVTPVPENRNYARKQKEMLLRCLFDARIWFDAAMKERCQYHVLRWHKEGGRCKVIGYGTVCITHAWQLGHKKVPVYQLSKDE